MNKKKKRIEELEKIAQEPNFWEDTEKAGEINQEMFDLKEEIDNFNKLKLELDELNELIDLAEKDEKIYQELEKKYNDFEKKFEKEETHIFLSGKYDKNNAILQIFSGAGGVDAQDWATMLLRMFERYCQNKKFKIKKIQQSFGEAGGPEGRIGTKSATLEIKGKFAYGILKKETGVHRLVRQSPFSSKDLRHTSFVLVEVIPEITKKQEDEIKIKSDDLKIETFRASGPGGQHVNKRESAVRIIHIPTGISVSSQEERLQGLNKEKAMKVLYSKLSQLKEKERKEKIKEIRGDMISASWGNQIRSYVFHPYKLIKDLRTGIETSNVEKVLDGELDEFIEVEIKEK
ncbi:MAG: peptide chain release factor 2 [Candidatus Nealsonbacteria bacterium]